MPSSGLLGSQASATLSKAEMPTLSSDVERLLFGSEFCEMDFCRGSIPPVPPMQKRPIAWHSPPRPTCTTRLHRTAAIRVRADPGGQRPLAISQREFARRRPPSATAALLTSIFSIELRLWARSCRMHTRLHLDGRRSAHFGNLSPFTRGTGDGAEDQAGADRLIPAHAGNGWCYRA